jgi:amino acid transporter
MNFSASHNNDHLLLWVATTLLLMGFALGDTAIIAWCASLVSLWELTASALAYVLIAVGMLFTIWQMSEISNKRTRHL